jgi:hypothetical protein
MSSTYSSGKALFICISRTIKKGAREKADNVAFPELCSIVSAFVIQDTLPVFIAEYTRPADPALECGNQTKKCRSISCAIYGIVNIETAVVCPEMSEKSVIIRESSAG